MTKVNNYWQAHNGPEDNNWASAAYWLGDVAAYDATGNTSYLNAASSWAKSSSYKLYTGVTAPYNTQAAGQVYIRLSEIQSQPSDLTHIESSIDAMLKSSGNSDWSIADAI
ncbi:MAG TPA: glycoside hydrolase family 88 protein, partial [Candidatus Baltobacteraceae bacterium]